MYTASAMILIGFGFILYCGYEYSTKVVQQIGFVATVFIVGSFLSTVVAVSWGVWLSFYAAKLREINRPHKRTPAKRKED